MMDIVLLQIKKKILVEFTLPNVMLMKYDDDLSDAQAQIKGLTMTSHVMHGSKTDLPLSLYMRIPGDTQGLELLCTILWNYNGE